MSNELKSIQNYIHAIEKALAICGPRRGSSLMNSHLFPFLEARPDHVSALAALHLNCPLSVTSLKEKGMTSRAAKICQVL